MEILNVSTRNNGQILSGIPTFYNIKTLNQKFPFRYKKPSSKFYKDVFSVHLTNSNTRKFQIWAHFGRPTCRRNSLRKKLLDDQQVRLNQNFADSSSSFSDISSLKEKNCNLEESDVGPGVLGNVVENVGVEKTKSKISGDSVLMSKLENWVDQYKKDIEYWGIGSSPIFTVYQDSQGNVKQVSVDEREILRRSRVEQEEIVNFPEVNYKILSAKSLAGEMEHGNSVIPRNSSVAKFVVQGQEAGYVRAIRGFTIQSELLPNFKRVGSGMLCAFVIMWALKELFTFGDNKEVQYTEMEKEMMSRKIKSRREKEMLAKGTVEVVPEPTEPQTIGIEMPKLDKEQLKNNILKVKAASDKLVVQNSSAEVTTGSRDPESKVQEIREMARRAREIEERSSLVSRNMEMDDLLMEESPNEVEAIKEHCNEDTYLYKQHSDKQNATLQTPSVDFIENSDYLCLHEVDGCDLHASTVEVSDARNINKQELEFTDSTVHLKDKEDSQNLETPIDDSTMKCFENKKPRIIRSVKEARDYLLQKNDKQDPSAESKIECVKENVTDLSSSTDGFCSQKSQVLEMNTIVSRSNTLVGKHVINACEETNQEENVFDLMKNDYINGSGVENGVKNPQKYETSLDHEVNGMKTENWLGNNFHEVEPIIKKIRAGFRDNYTVAKKQVDQPLDMTTELEPPAFVEDGGELDWMQDDCLRDIVFKVRDNELAGQDPFYMIDDKDKEAFFRGLEKKVEKENKKLSYLHEWLHSNIENLDYGADGISIYDPPEKIIPRWKGPPMEKIPEFLNDFLEQRKTISTKNMSAVKKDGNGFPQKSKDPSFHENFDASVETYNPKTFTKENQKNLKTVIEGSDGSVKAGKKSGKEYWQHTKKWSRGFLESYNAETDPEIKSVMRDMGKDLDRWITEKEIEEAADLMTKVPDKNRSILENKLNKLKREMELFGPQAVVSKYREYADEEEDYLWWLDLSYVLCIELYTIDEGEQRVGFYSLEMAADLELEPKPYHVIAFQDAADCKNLCCIIQAHMDMLGNGHAFVVARPPKDAFREAKANGFGVTVIKKGELQLNIDQALDEVEEQIAEIGSKMYHDMMMKERSVDINSLMKGVFGFSRRSIKRTLKRKLKKTSKG